MRIGRTLPPAAAFFGWRDLGHAVAGTLLPERALRAREEEIRQHFDVQHVSLVSSGTAALALALASLKELSDRTDVVIPAFTCYSVPAAVVKAGLRPVLCDVDPSTFDFDHTLLERTLTDNTLCVIAHHLFGVPSDIAGLRKICQSRDVFLVEDAAQAMGVQAGGAYLGTTGDVGIFSLGRGKNITAGSGGVIVARMDSIVRAVDRQCRRLIRPSLPHVCAEFVRLVIMAVFIRPSLYWIPAALPFLRLGDTIFPERIALRHLSGMQAGLLHHWRRRLSQSNYIRSENAADLSRRLSLSPRCGSSHPYLRLPVLAATPDDKKRICTTSHRLGLGMSVAYPLPIDQIPQMKSYVDARRFPGATKLAEQLVTLPTHHWITERDKRAITRCLSQGACAVLPEDTQQTTSSFEPARHG